MKNFLPRLMM